MTIHRVDSTLWDDESFIEFDDATRNVWCLLLTGPHRTVLPGLQRVGIAALAETLRRPVDQVGDCLGRILAANTDDGGPMLEVDAAKRVIRLPQAPKHNPAESPNQIRAWWTRFREVPDCELRRRHVEALRDHARLERPAHRQAWEQTFGTLEVGRRHVSINPAEGLIDAAINPVEALPKGSGRPAEAMTETSSGLERDNRLERYESSMISEFGNPHEGLPKPSAVPAEAPLTRAHARAVSGSGSGSGSGSEEGPLRGPSATASEYPAVGEIVRALAGGATRAVATEDFARELHTNIVVGGGKRLPDVLEAIREVAMDVAGQGLRSDVLQRKVRAYCQRAGSRSLRGAGRQSPPPERSAPPDDCPEDFA
ncbi:MAG: hypothetical protein HOW73_43635 [Polyangiaceae bacterium]|nr:hypothetical protein [Polyangiaceae bacterium]